MAATGRKMTLKQKVILIRELSGWKDKQIAEKVGRSHQAIGHYATGEITSPGPTVRRKIDRLLQDFIDTKESQVNLLDEGAKIEEAPPEKYVEEEMEDGKTPERTRTMPDPGWLGVTSIKPSGGLIRRILKKTGCSHQHLADRLGVDREIIEPILFSPNAELETELWNKIHFVAGHLNWDNGEWPEEIPDGTRRYGRRQPHLPSSNGHPVTTALREANEELKTELEKVTAEKDQLTRDIETLLAAKIECQAIFTKIAELAMGRMSDGDHD